MACQLRKQVTIAGFRLQVMRQCRCRHGKHHDPRELAAADQALRCEHAAGHLHAVWQLVELVHSQHQVGQSIGKQLSPV